MGKVKGAVMIGFGALVLAVSVKSFVTPPKINGQLDNVIYIEDGKVLPENEGKLVMVSGEIKGVTPLKDNVTGINLPSLTAERHVEVYKNRLEDGETVWYWDTVSKDYSEKGNYGINTNFLVSSTLVASSTLGDSKLSNELLVPIDRSQEFTDYDYDNLNEAGLNIFDGDMEHKYYLSPSETMPMEVKKEINAYKGLVRMYYSITPSDDPLIYTIIGIQKGDTLVKSNDFDGISTYKGVVKPEDIKDNVSGTIGGLFVGLVTSFLLIFYGIKIIKRYI
ncbi:MAG: hypothetical protein ACI4VF_02275 [Lachnospirales bacterium]